MNNYTSRTNRRHKSAVIAWSSPVMSVTHDSQSQSLSRDLDIASCLEKIQISDRFVTRLHICAVVQTLHIYKKTIQTPNKF